MLIKRKGLNHVVCCPCHLVATKVVNTEDPPQWCATSQGFWWGQRVYVDLAYCSYSLKWTEGENVENRPQRLQDMVWVRTNELTDPLPLDGAVICGP